MVIGLRRMDPAKQATASNPPSRCGLLLQGLGGGLKSSPEDVTLAAQRGGGGLEPFGISPRD